MREYVLTVTALLVLEVLWKSFLVSQGRVNQPTRASTVGDILTAFVFIAWAIVVLVGRN